MRVPGFRNSGSGQYRRLGDEDLMERVCAGDDAAFDVVYERHGTIAFSLAFRICGSRAAAEDVVQEAFVAAWRRSSTFDPTRGSLRAWLLTIVHRRAIDLLRRAGRQATSSGVEELELDSGERVDSDVVAREHAAAVRGGVASLPSEQRQVIELAFFGGFTHAEIADMLALPLGTVKGRMRLALDKLRGRFDPAEAIG